MRPQTLNTMTQQEREQLIKDYEKRIAASEARMQRIQEQMRDRETYLESGYYLEMDLRCERSYCSVLYDKLHRLQAQG